MASIVRAAAAARQAFSGALQPVTSQSYRCLQTLSRFTSCIPTTSRFSNCFSSSALTVSPTLSSSSLISSPSFACTSTLLSVTKQLGPITTHRRSYHVRLALKKRCSSCYFVRRKGRLFVDCKAKPRHKQMQMMSKRKTWKEDYSKGNIEKAIFWKYGEQQYYKGGDNQYARYNWLKGKIGVTV